MLSMRLECRRQRGFMLIETLVAILIFSIGVLSLVGLQATSVRLSSGAKYRSDAALLVNELIGERGRPTASPPTCRPSSTPVPRSTRRGRPPSSAALPTSAASAPSVVVANDGQITIDIFWKAPNEDGTEPAHRPTRRLLVSDSAAT